MPTPLDTPKRSVTRVTLDGLDGTHGRDRGRKLIATLAFGDVLILKPKGRRGDTAAKVLRLPDLYSYALRCEANRSKMERLRLRKEKKEEARRNRAWKAELRRAQTES